MPYAFQPLPRGRPRKTPIVDVDDDEEEEEDDDEDDDAASDSYQVCHVSINYFGLTLIIGGIIGRRVQRRGSKRCLHLSCLLHCPSRPT